MAFDTSKTLLLEKRYLYVRASKGFILEGVSTERIWTNVGYYRFLTENVSEALGNSYVKINYDSLDSDFVAYCSDLFLEEIQNSVTVAVENIEATVNSFASTNHNDIDGLSTNLGTALGQLYDEVNTIKSNVYALVNNQGNVYKYDVTRFDKYGLKVDYISSDGTCSVDLDSVLDGTGSALIVVKYTGPSTTGDIVFTCSTSDGVYALYSNCPMQNVGNNVASNGNNVVFTSDVGSLVQNGYYIFKIVGYKVG